MKKRILITMLAVVMLLSSMAFSNAATVTGKINTETINDVEAYVFVPESSMLGKRPTSSPVMLVFGDKNYTAETALSTAQSSGLGDIAATEGTVVMFINSKTGTWGEDDVASYLGALGLFSNASTDVFVDGKSEKGQYPGNVEGRIYIYAEGKGADFAALNLMKAVKNKVTFPDGFSMEFDRTPSSYMLFNTSVVPTAQYEGMEFPAAVVNAAEGTEAALKALNPKHGFYAVETSTVKDGFDPALIKSLYANPCGNVRRQVSVIHEIPNYSALGIIENRKSFAVGEKNIEYIEYIPSTAKMTSTGTVPLIMIFHGGGNTADYHAWLSEWPLIAKEAGAMVVSVQDHTNYPANELVELLENLFKQYPAIDKTRVYASGFSMGSLKSFELGFSYPEYFAGIAPMDAINASMLGVTEAPDMIIPAFYVGGETSPLPEFPFQGDTSEENLAMLFKANQVTSNYKYNEALGKWWGIAADGSFTRSNSVFTTSVHTVSYYKSTDGNVYTELCNVSNQSHEIYAENSYAAWDFLSRFSRNADGSISIAEDHYIDVPSTHVYAKEIDSLNALSIMGGVGNGFFAPDAPLTRAMTATVLYRLAGFPSVSGSNSFTDVADGQWYTDAIIWASENGITEGYGDGRFGTFDNISRQDFATFLHRYAKLSGKDASKAKDISGFTDADAVGTWAVDALKWAAAEGIVNGRSQTQLAPTATASRGEAAVMLSRFIG